MNEQLLNQLNLYIWAKDKSFRYVYVNENYAKAAGMDSPHQMIGKTDDQMPWRHLADEFKRGDCAVLQGACRINSVEKSDTLDNVKDMLVTETQFVDKDGKCIGVKGSFVDITGKELTRKSGFYNAEQQRYYLGVEELGDVYLTPRELEIFKRMLLGYTNEQIAKLLGVSTKTIETFIRFMKFKFQADSKADIITTAIQYGLTHVMYLAT